MTIVASNSLTVSNVNDGTITHTAYANSADGTLDFNPDYKSAVGLDILNIINWTKNTSMSNSTYNFARNADNSFKVTGRGTSGYEVLSKSFPAKVGDKLMFTVRYTNRLSFGLFSGYGLQFVVNSTYIESTTSTSKIVLPNEITVSTEYQLEYTATSSNVWMQLNFGGVADSSQVDFDVKIEVENLTNPVKYAYLGNYSDYTITDSINPSDYTWKIFRGKDGKDGDMGKSVWSYPYNRGANRVGSYWSDLKPAPTTDNPPKVGDTIIDLVGNIYQITNVVVGTAQQGGGIFDYGPILTSVKGTDGDPGKIVSDTEPTTRFKGLTWKYSGTTDLTASDGTVIHPNTEYYYNGTHWMINYLSANNFEANSITADLIDAKNLTITDGEFVSTIIDGSVQIQTEIKDNHLLIYKMDTSHDEIHTIALKSDSGLAMTYQNSDTGEYTSAGVNFQGLFMQNNITNEFARLTPQGTKLSTDVPWTDITRASGVGTSGTLRARINNGVFYVQSKDVTTPSIAPNSIITIGTMSSKFSGVSGFDTLGLLYSPGQLSVASVSVGSDGKINIGNPNPTTMSGKVIQFSANIPLG